MATDRVVRTRELWRLLEPITAVTYFTPEPLAQLKAAGYRGFWMGYFAGRAAPLGAAPADLVHALGRGCVMFTESRTPRHERHAANGP